MRSTTPGGGQSTGGEAAHLAPRRRAAVNVVVRPSSYGELVSYQPSGRHGTFSRPCLHDEHDPVDCPNAKEFQALQTEAGIDGVATDADVSDRQSFWFDRWPDLAVLANDLTDP